MKHLLTAMWLTCMLLGPVFAVRSQQHKAMKDTGNHLLNVKYEQMKWEKTDPALGERSPEITILRVDPKTQATQLMIRVPKDFHVPMHWHTANETHTIVNGTFIMACGGITDTLTAGSFNYIPAKMHHEAWTTSDNGSLLFITVDKAWDINWVGGPPKPEDYIPKRKNKGTSNKKQ
jgi:mannose-6-phosphate isomerase-like protein (cupin superfamily)